MTYYIIASAVAALIVLVTIRELRYHFRPLTDEEAFIRRRIAQLDNGDLRMRFEFEWGLQLRPNGSATVHERLVGTELVREYQLPSRTTAEAFIKARRAFVHRTVTSRTQAIQIFSPQGTIIQ